MVACSAYVGAFSLRLKRVTQKMICEASVGGTKLQEVHVPKVQVFEGADRVRACIHALGCGRSV